VSIQRREFYFASCDDCGENFTELGDTDTTVYDSEKEIVEHLEYNEWEIKDGVVICDNCMIKKENKLKEAK
jgi:hypothetical protein